ncbi:MAG: tyrosine-type recombinase/integrase [Leptospiraceae bacterium]|nr:tyrosine-type recombinase/integrase [Leptospiraceae bacterium]MDW8307387.1 tyrosine-type recombinase/integrase [Leptospiraceae bacterium]
MSKVSQLKEGYLELYDQYLACEKSYPPNTRSAYLRDVRQFLDYLKKKDLQEFSTETVYAWLNSEFAIRRSRKAQKIIRSSQARKIASLRSFFSFLEKRKLLEENPMRWVRVAKWRRPLPRPVLPIDMSRLLEDKTMQKNLLQLRDRALFETCYSTGMRISEALHVKISDIMDGEGIVSSLKVFGKGGKERIVFLGEKAKEALGAYLRVRPLLVKQKNTEALFVNAHGGALTRTGAALILRRRRLYLNIARHYTPHSFRHAFATDLLNAGADIRHVQEMLGHSSLSTTQRYLAVAQERLQEIYRSCHPHGRKKSPDSLAAKL